MSAPAGPPQEGAANHMERAQPANDCHPLPGDGGRGEGGLSAFRPQPARWFEIVLARDDAAAALAALAATGAVELETRNACTLPEALADIAPLLAEYRAQAARYQAYWPGAGWQPSPFPEAPVQALTRSLAVLRTWAAEAEPLIVRLQRCEAGQQEALLWQRLLETQPDSRLDFAALAAGGPLLAARLLALPAHHAVELPPGALLLRLAGGDPAYSIVVVPAAALEALAQQVAGLKGLLQPIPVWLANDPATLAQRLTGLAAETSVLRGELDVLHDRHGVRRALGDAARLQWLLRHVPALDAGEWIAWVTGWTDAEGTALEASLERAGVPALLHFPQPPAGRTAPLLLRNPWWARPFELFARALGMPGASEADPSRLLAVVTPLMFGYMFGDLGQGLLIAAAGFLLRKRYPLARLFIAGGLAAALFGLAFGSVFAREGLLPALWMHPLDEPLTALAMPVAGGALLLLAGLGLGGLQAHWRGGLQRWLWRDAWLIAVYLGLTAGLLHPAGFLLAGLGALACCIGALHAPGDLAALPAALGQLVERTLQLLINTLSFARIGAFALAHAGLSAAVVALADAAGSASLPVLIAGNAFILALELLVVSVQTTRLVLFEFFVRFLTAEGRAFRPLPPPDFTHRENPQ